MSDDTLIAWLRAMEKKLDEGLSTVVEQIHDMQGTLSEMQRCGLDESRATITTREQCRKEIGDRLDKLESRGLGTMIWESRRFVLSIVAGLGAGIAIWWPQVAPVLRWIQEVGR